MKRKLSRDEAALWDRLAKTVEPINPHRNGDGGHPKHGGGAPSAKRNLAIAREPVRALPPLRGPLHRAGEDLGAKTLDATWDRKLAKGQVQPDYTIDLHGASLDAAHSRLDHGLALALNQGARAVLLITGRPRPSGDHAGRGERRGAIRSKFLDWLAAGPHAARIAAIRPAHPKHGGAGAVYVILRRRGQ